MSDRPVRKGVVLAAGSGERLKETFPEPKPLIQVGGVPIIHRTFDVLIRGGVDQLCVVIGHRAAEVSAAVEAFAERREVSISLVYNERWQEPNGLSLHAARQFTAADEFILSMSDHLFEPGMVDLLQAVDHDDERDVTLAIDSQVDRVFDLDDATKVLCEDNNRIVKIGKSLRRYNAIDCGIFRCNANVYDALEGAFHEREHSISAGMQLLARRGRFWGAPIGELYWQDIDTPEMHQVSERLLAERA
jgi:1L-myo-inositol 1-phosphate cytidylyltransferase